MSIPYVPKKSNRVFYVPPTLESDFDNFLNTDIPNTVMSFNLISDWYDAQEEDYTHKVIRGEIYPISTNNKYENADHYIDFRTTVKSGAKKGDMLTNDTEDIYLIDWQPLLAHNNAPMRVLRCNGLLTFSRWKNEVTDRKGYLIEEAGNKIIASDLPCSIYKYKDRPEWAAYSDNPGLIPNALVVLVIQYNQKTKDIEVGDNFQWNNAFYDIVDVDFSGLDLYKRHGVINLQAKKRAGGDI